MIIAGHVVTVEENVKCRGLDEVESKYPSSATSTLVSSRGEENDGDHDLIHNNVFQTRICMMNRNK